MTAWENLLASVGVGAATLTLELGTRTFPRGAQIHGALRLEGGSVEQHIYTLTVKLGEFWGSKRIPTRSVLLTEVLGQEIVVAAREDLTFPFAFQVPDDALLSSSQSGCYLEAVADIFWSVNPGARIDLNVVPHRELLAIHGAMRMLGFSEAEWDDMLSVITYSHIPEGLRQQLNGVALRLKIEEDYVTGRLLLDRSEYGLVERLRAFAGHDREEHDVLIPRQELLDAQGQPFPTGASPYLNDIFEAALVMPGNDRKWLLRGASKPEDAEETLLRPAVRGEDIRPDELLRAPSEDPR